MIKKYVNISVNNREYTVIVELDPKRGIFIGQCKQVPGAISQGNSMQELLGNMREAIPLVVESIIEEAKRLDASVKKNNLTMEEIVEEVKIVRHMRKD